MLNPGINALVALSAEVNVIEDPMPYRDALSSIAQGM
jgi:hypothetical protein